MHSMDGDYSSSSSSSTTLNIRLTIIFKDAVQFHLFGENVPHLFLRKIVTTPILCMSLSQLRFISFALYSIQFVIAMIMAIVIHTHKVTHYSMPSQRTKIMYDFLEKPTTPWSY